MKHTAPTSLRKQILVRAVELAKQRALVQRQNTREDAHGTENASRGREGSTRIQTATNAQERRVVEDSPTAREPVATSSTLSYLGRPTSGSVIDGRWVGATLDAVLAVSVPEDAQVDSPMTDSPRTPPAASTFTRTVASTLTPPAVSTHTPPATSTLTPPISSAPIISPDPARPEISHPIPTPFVPPFDHPACLCPGVLATSTNAGAVQYSIPHRDRPGSQRHHTAAQAHPTPAWQHGAAPPVDFFVDGRPYNEAIFSWRECMHGYRTL